MKSVKKAYLLWGLGLFGCMGLHRYYLEKPKSGKLYLLTLGFLFIGSAYDLLAIPLMVKRYNISKLLIQKKQNLKKIRKIKSIVVNQNNYEAAAWYREKENQILKDIENCKVILKNKVCI